MTRETLFVYAVLSFEMLCFEDVLNVVSVSVVI